MKKLLLFLTAIFTINTLYASNGDDNVITLVAVISLIIGILVLVYFFKLCIDISAIREVVAPKNAQKTYLLAIASLKAGNKDLARERALQIISITPIWNIYHKKALEIISSCDQ